MRARSRRTHEAHEIASTVLTQSYSMLYARSLSQGGPRNFVKYYEEETVNKTKTNATWIDSSHDFLDAMHRL